MNKLLALLAILLVVIAIVVACNPPHPGPGPTPTPAPEQVGRLSLDELRAIVAERQGSRSVMFDGSAAGVNNGGPWNDVHAFPRIIASDGGYFVADSNNAHLGDLARYHAILWNEDWPTYYNYSTPPSQTEPFSYTRSLNPDIRFIAGLRAYQYPDSSCGISATFPNRCAIYTAADTADGATASGDGWLALNTLGAPIKPSTADEDTWYINLSLIHI